ncbi:hypothetical protein MKR37_04325 [Staphylococcus haemolyticus]|uniref:hypothetical protein n=1 Tax=Staphylococcus haemolyticus TaxID=1283 RepID=UPI001F0A3F4F|nr:hypothetical protein [Staphylococcus haemolyticus]MCH4482940.1 hypothetical protein [Staphylococcus haemolyticus]
MLVYKLAPVLGGRREVLETPFVDCLGYLIAEFEKDEQKANEEAQRLYLNHISRMLSKPESKEAQKQNEKFMKQISPNNTKTSNAPKQHRMVGNKKLEWDSLDKLKALENR